MTRMTVMNKKVFSSKNGIDEEMKLFTWLDCITQSHAGKKTISCTTCGKFKEQIEVIVTNGAYSLRTSNICNHAKTNKYFMTMRGNMPSQEEMTHLPMLLLIKL